MATPQPQASPLWPADDQHPRPKRPRVRVYAPDGSEEWHTLENAADLCRRPRYAPDGSGLPQWSLSPPLPPEEMEGYPQGEEDAGPYPVVPADTRPLTAVTLDKLTRAREELKALGVEPDPTWGLRRLAQELAKRRPKESRPPSGEDEDNLIDP